MDYQEAIEVLNGSIPDINKVVIARAVVVSAMQELEQYHQLGTLEEVRLVVEEHRRSMDDLK